MLKSDDDPEKIAAIEDFEPLKKRLAVAEGAFIIVTGSQISNRGIDAAQISYLTAALSREPEIPPRYQIKKRPKKTDPFWNHRTDKYKKADQRDIDLLLKHARKLQKKKVTDTDIEHENLIALPGIFGMDERYGRILSYLWLHDRSSDFFNLQTRLYGVEDVTREKALRIILIARFCGMEVKDVEVALGPTSPLVEGGIITFDSQDRGDNKISVPILNPQIVKLLQEPNVTLQSMQEKYTGAQEETPDPSEIPTMEELGDVVGNPAYLNGLIMGMPEGEGRRHILIYAPPGYGKTHYINALRAHSKVKLIKLGEDRKRGDQKSDLTPKQRLEDILIGRMLFKSTKTLMFVDDADGILDYAEKVTKQTDYTISKVIVLRLLEEDGMVWVVNSQTNIPDAARSRFIAAYAFPPLKAERRRAMLFKKPPRSGLMLAKAPSWQVLWHILPRNSIFPYGILKTWPLPPKQR